MNTTRVALWLGIACTIGAVAAFVIGRADQAAPLGLLAIGSFALSATKPAGR